MREPEPEDYPFPRNKDELLRDFTVVGRLKDIRDSETLKERLTPKWWEALVGLAQFAAALGLLASLLHYPPLLNHPMGRLLAFWGTLTVLSLIFGFELILMRLHHLRRAYQISLRRIEDLTHRLEAMETERQPAESEKKS